MAQKHPDLDIYIYMFIQSCACSWGNRPNPNLTTKFPGFLRVQRLIGRPESPIQVPWIPWKIDEWLAGKSTEFFNRKYHWLIQIVEFLPAIVMSFFSKGCLKIWMDSLRLNKKQTVLLKWFNSITLQGTNISPQNGILKMFFFPRWDMLIPWRVTSSPTSLPLPTSSPSDMNVFSQFWSFLSPNRQKLGNNSLIESCTYHDLHQKGFLLT